MSKPKILREYFSLGSRRNSDTSLPLREGQMQVRSESGVVLLTGIIQRADTLNQNGRIYPRKMLEREISNYMKFIREKRALGELDHPESLTVEYKNCSHIITDIWWDGDAVIGEIRLLNTPSGKVAQALVSDDVTIGISSRGFGSTFDRGDHQIVGDDFTLICWDLVQEPSTSKAFLYADEDSYKMNLESIQRKIPESTIHESQDSEEDFLSMLINLKKK